MKYIKDIGFMLLLLFAVLLISFGIIIGITYFVPDLNNRALLGDSFGVVNSLFSGLALFAIAISLSLQNDSNKMQKEDLKLAREEMKLTREELKKTLETQIEQINIMRLQLIDHFEERLTNYKNNNSLSLILSNMSPHSKVYNHPELKKISSKLEKLQAKDE